MLKTLKLKSPSALGQSPLSLPLKPSVTIFVGPNNSGKSLLLNELTNFCQAGLIGDHTLILDRIHVNSVDRETAEADYEKIKRKAGIGEKINSGRFHVEINGRNILVNKTDCFLAREKPNEGDNIRYFSQYYLAPRTLSLNGQARMTLLNSSPMGDLKNPLTPMGKIFTDDLKREKWRNIIHDAFGLYPGIDATHGGKLSVRFGKTSPADERSLGDANINWMKAARSLNEVSDGVNAFTGMLLQIYAGDPEVILIDEPEAFLHPSLARMLGKELASAALTESKYVFVATHSAEFVMGAILSGADVNIIRLTYDNNNDVATARLLPSEELKQLMNDPMLRSVGVLSGLFFQNVIVTEGDSDRAFYQEINERLTAEGDSRAIPHALFLNAGNHQTIPSIITPLRKLGIPAAAIYDLDVIKLGKQEWKKNLELLRCQRLNMIAMKASEKLFLMR